MKILRIIIASVFAFLLIMACENKSETYSAYFEHQKDVAVAEPVKKPKHTKQSAKTKKDEPQKVDEPAKKDEPTKEAELAKKNDPVKKTEPVKKDEIREPEKKEVEQPKPKPNSEPSNPPTPKKEIPTVLSYDGIEYAYEAPTTAQLHAWADRYASLCQHKIAGKTSRYDIPKEMISKHPCLVYLVLISKSMEDDKEKQSWFDLYSLMNQEQIDKLYDILYRERYKLNQIEEKYKK